MNKIEIKPAAMRGKVYISRNSDKLLYEVYRGENAKPNYVRYDWVREKTMALNAWLDNKGIVNVKWSDKLFGTVQAYQLMEDTTAAVEWHCQLYRIECEALICEEFDMMEGCYAVVTLHDGRIVKGYVHIGGRVIKYHQIVKSIDKKYGRRIRRGEAKHVKVIAV